MTLADKVAILLTFVAMYTTQWTKLDTLMLLMGVVIVLLLESAMGYFRS